ncbi:hypothetical protein SBA2_740025 [Acidobacteriia bacterium SbA2]|nr:hypothetical protein SBA2_740025 [Acidobacteriia bacterium SbA2]
MQLRRERRAGCPRSRTFSKQCEIETPPTTNLPHLTETKESLTVSAYIQVVLPAEAPGHVPGGSTNEVSKRGSYVQ